MLLAFALWNRIFSVVRQREEKCELALFSFAHGAFAVFALVFFFVLTCSFYFVLASANKRESPSKKTEVKIAGYSHFIY